MGLIETEAEAPGVTYERGTFPWAASDLYLPERPSRAAAPVS